MSRGTANSNGRIRRGLLDRKDEEIRQLAGQVRADGKTLAGLMQQLNTCQMQAHSEWLELTKALRDLIGFYDRVAASRGDWTVPEIKRLAEIRAIVGTL